MWYDGLSPIERLCHQREGRQSIISHSFKVGNCFITSNILHPAIIIWYSDDPYSVNSASRFIYGITFRHYKFAWKMKVNEREVTGFRNMWVSQGNFHGVFSCAVDITMRPNVQRLIERNVKCHVSFFRLIKFKISIWICNNISWQTLKL